MPLVLSSHVTMADFPEIATSIYEASLCPRKPTFRLACRDVGDRDAEVAQTREMCELAMSEKPHMRWLKVVDTDDSQQHKIVGGAMYELHEANPFGGQYQRPTAYNYPDGAERELITQLIESMSWVREERMSRPHICGLCLSILIPCHKSQTLPSCTNRRVESITQRHGDCVYTDCIKHITIAAILVHTLSIGSPLSTSDRVRIHLPGNLFYH